MAAITARIWASVGEPPSRFAAKTGVGILSRDDSAYGREAAAPADLAQIIRVACAVVLSSQQPRFLLGWTATPQAQHLPA